MILLYVVLSNLQPGYEEELLQDVETSLGIFKAMNVVVVSRRCAEVIQEVLDVAKSLQRSRQRMQNLQNERHSDRTAHHRTTAHLSTEDASSMTFNSILSGNMPLQNAQSSMADFSFGLFPDDVFTDLLDLNLVDDLNKDGDGFMGIIDFQSDGWIQ
jgi:hypothetical protein